MATEYGYLQLDGEVHGPLSRTESRAAVAEQPDGDWRYAPHGIDFEPLPDWVREKAPEPAPSSPSLPLAIARRWSDPDAWFKRMTYIGAVAVLIGFFLPIISSEGRFQIEFLWDGLASVEWTWYGAFTVALVLILGVLVPILLMRGPPSRRRAVYVLIAAGLAFWLHADSPHAYPAYGEVYHSTLVDPPRETQSGAPDGSSPSGMIERVNPDAHWLLAGLLLAGCVLIFAGTRADARHLGRGPPRLTQAGGWIVIAAFLVPYWGDTLLEFLYVDTVSRGRPMITTVLAGAVLLLGILAALSGWRPRDPRTACQLRRWLIYAIGLVTPLIIYGVLADQYGPSMRIASAVLRDTFVAYGLLFLMGAGLSAWAIDAASLQRKPTAPELFIPGSPQRRQGTFALGLLILAVAPTPVPIYDGFRAGEMEAAWWFERVLDFFQADGGEAWRAGPRLDRLLWPLILAGVLYLASRMRDRRKAVVVALVTLVITAARPIDTLATGLGSFGIITIQMASWSQGWEEVQSFVRMGFALNLGLSLICGALIVARGNARAPGVTTALRIGGVLTAVPLLVVPLAESVSGIWVATAFTAKQTWPYAIAAVGIAALGVVAVLEPRAGAARDRRRGFLSRLLLPGLILGMGSFGLALAMSPGGGRAGAEFLWLSQIRWGLELTLMTLLFALWTAEAIRLFAVDPALRQQRVFE